MWLALLIATPLTSSAPAQVPPAAKADQPKAAATPEEAEAAAPVAPRAANAAQEIYPDNLSKQALQVFNPLTYPAPPFKVVGTPNEKTTVQSMASNGVAPNENQIRRYVEFYAAELSKRDNLNAFINPTPQTNPNTAKAIERAVSDLITPITVARANNNPNNFLGIYTRQLFDSNFAKLLDNNLIARIDAMIVLGMVGSTVPKDLDVYINQINKADQVMWVKLWAARGLTNATSDGKNPLDATKTIQAVEALTKFLGSDAKTMPWPVQIRALEAAGSLRTAVSISQRGRTDAASAVMPYLVDPSMRIESRAWAARSLGLMIPPASVRPYNFALLGDAIGQVAADLGDRIVNEYDQNAANFANASDEATRLTSLLLFQINAAIAGEPGVKESGLAQMTHPDARSQSAYFKELGDKIQLEAKTAVDFLKAPGADQKGLRDKIAGQVKDLRAFLASKPPKDRRLVPEGPVFANVK